VAIENIEEAIEVVDPDYRICYVNPAWERLTGWTLAEAVGQTAVALMRSGQHPPSFYEQCDSAMAQRREWRAVFTSRKRDGSTFLNALVATAVVDADGAVRFMVAVRRDITEEHRAQEALRESERRYHLAALATRDGLFDWWPAQDSLYASLRLRQMAALGSDTELAIDALLSRIHAEDVQRARLAFTRAQERPGSSFDIECRVSIDTGACTWVQLRGFSEPGQDGQTRRVVGAVTDISDRKHSESELFSAATHDPLTGLANRSLLLDRVRAALAASARRDGPAIALLYLDLRRFKQINDGFGHAAGDAVLVEVAARLRRATRPGDTVARLGGDEFATLLVGVHNEEQTRAAARRVLRALEAPHIVNGQTVFVPATVGATLASHAADVDGLLRAADTAMYEARNRGDTELLIVGPEAGARAVREAFLSRDLRSACLHAGIRLAYQPVVAMPSRRIVGAEALARWTHPELGEVGPAEFVPLAEGLRLGQLLALNGIEAAREAAALWAQKHALGPDFTVSVNLTSRQLVDPEVLARLAQHDLGSHPSSVRLGVELTETALFERPDEINRAIRDLRREGVRFALDDFGTGFSSLAHLVEFPVGSIKLDRSLVCRLGVAHSATQLIAGVVALAHRLDLAVVAEGVETAEQEARLVELGCPFGQGWLYGAALSPEEFSDVLGVVAP
jgi:diguanylate cyclase (GGDEF)-like protein/PAS domain S-box-containing protein